eukprot:TRINITY_DN10842_c0_g1_i1.p1 TRINITY_DN10842_c0_g1~~TRINITY_DN10842_c0_g1_i1.p1  ORF type:complete len:515 (-),score=155.29 TRINITY_DN10842_c0_g1_i1:171-1715(-)
MGVFDGFEICGQKLALKCNTATRKFIDHFESIVSASIVEEDKQRDQDVKDMIAQMMADGEVGKKKEGGSGGDKGDSGGLQDGRGRGESGSRATIMRDSVLDYLERIERNMERERQRDERNEEYRRAEDERLYQRRLQEWDRVEKDKLHERERYRERLKENDKERGKLIKMDNETFQDEDVAAWKRKPYRMTSRAHTRAHRRQTELEDDEEDRRREMDEDRKRAKKRKAEEEAMLEHQEENKKAKWQEVPPPVLSFNEQTEKQQQQQMHQPVKIQEQTQKLFEQSNAADKQNIKKETQEVDPNDPIYAAMVAAAAQDNPILTNGKEEKPVSTAKDESKTTSTSEPEKRAKQVLAAFKTEEEDDNKKPRKLVPIQYSAEELRAQVVKPEGGTSEEDDHPQDRDGKTQDPQVALRLLADKIPRSKEQVWKYKIRWDRYDTSTAGSNIRRWLTKKVMELLGEEENSLVDFIIQKLNDKFGPKEMMQQIGELLDDEAETFVLKLYRMVIYETEKAAILA